ncbi:phosphatidylinositol 4-phosphate 5-kinase 8-like isoform X1 [Malus domestica]|uniref:phosphatidylinositol 4-phosphate 5-kinase 8-like isoform X1 n=2 Tax=Malus domestica TaxID=3750 RepID=UPI0039766F77
MEYAVSEKAFSNGDVYVGNFKGTLPHGNGKYTWCDGTVYEGDWEEGKMTGKGKLIWTSGAQYVGDFSGGYLHGYGIFNGPDGSFYQGSWRMNIQHGMGKKQYWNSDIYEGSCKEGVQEGSGRYLWSSGNTYIGSWKGGKMCGRGIMKWENGDLYNGSWLNGLRDGCGVYKFPDGGYYFGTWSRGLKDGKGTFYPAGTKHPSLKKWCGSVGYSSDGPSSLSGHLLNSTEGNTRPTVKCSFSEKMSIGGILRNSRHISRKAMSLDKNWTDRYPSRDFIRYDSLSSLSQSSEDIEHEMRDNNTSVYEREYVQGVLVRERERNHTEISRKSKQRNNVSVMPKSSCIDMIGANISYYLMLNLQLGIRYTVGKITPVPVREVRPSDFADRARIRMYFPRKGSQFTPPHYSVDFYWKDYCPMVFRNLREMFKLDAAEYMMSICGDNGLREISSPGKSGSIFYISHDDRFFIKTLRKTELKVMLKMLPRYYSHVHEHENTLITKNFGLHRITLKGGKKVRFMVMGNMFCTELRIHRRYDLKGSTIGRCTDKDKIDENTTLKDLDLKFEFHMDKLLRGGLFKQISLDCMFLQSQQIIDYSLLLGLHFRAPEDLKGFSQPPPTMHNHESLPADDGVTLQGELVIPPKGLLLVTHEPGSVSTAPGPHIRGSPLKAYSLGDKEVDLLLPGTGRLRVQLGVNMPAQAKRKPAQEEVDSTEVELFEFYDVVLYMGIIDILQEYNAKKKLEHAYKSFKNIDPQGPQRISAVEPELYAKRFINFLEEVFPDLP